MATTSLRAILLRDNARPLRFMLWAIAMSATGMVVGWYWPHKAVYVPCAFIAIMVPSVLLPLRPNPAQRVH